MSEKISTVFIDIDGTLTDNFHIHTNGWKTISYLLGKELKYDFFNTLHGDDTSSAIKKIANQCDVNLTKFDLDFLIKMKNLIRDYEINKLNSNNLFPGVKLFLNSLQQNNVRIVCCAITSACRSILINLGIANFFHDYICGTDMKTLKSKSPDCYIDFINQNKLVASECLVIDDDINVLLGIQNSLSDIKYIGFCNIDLCIINNIPYITSYEDIDYKQLLNNVLSHSWK